MKDFLPTVSPFLLKSQDAQCLHEQVQVQRVVLESESRSQCNGW